MCERVCVYAHCSYILFAILFDWNTETVRKKIRPHIQFTNLSLFFGLVLLFFVCRMLFLQKRIKVGENRTYIFALQWHKTHHVISTLNMQILILRTFRVGLFYAMPRFFQLSTIAFTNVVVHYIYIHLHVHRQCILLYV